MTLTIEIKDDCLPAFRELAKSLNARLTISAENVPTQNATKENFINAVKSDIAAYKNGKLDCLNAQEFSDEMQDFMGDLAQKYAR